MKPRPSWARQEVTGLRSFGYVAWTYFSIVNEEGLQRIRDQYQIPEDVVLRILDLDERACLSKYDDVAFYEVDFNVGLRFPL